jgi:hypothetical protein
MSVVSVPSLDIFAPAIVYHTSAQTFLSGQESEILSRSKALSDELHTSTPQQAGEFDRVMQTLAQRFHDEAQLCQEASENLQSHFQFLATAEAKLSGTPPRTLPNLAHSTTGNWLQIQNTPVNSCFDELESKLYQYKRDLDDFGPRIQQFEHLIWVAVNQPDQLKNIVQVPSAGWEPDWLNAGIQDVTNLGVDAATAALRPAINYIQAHQADIYKMLDQMRQGFETIFLPRTDPHILQEHIDYLSALKSTYDRQIRAPFNDATAPIATQYQPPAGQDSYQRAWPTIADQQYHTSMVLGSVITQLQQIQQLNELIAIDLIIIVVAVGVFLIAIAVTAFIVTIIGTLPAMFISGESAAGGVIAVGGTEATFGSIFGAIFGATFAGIPLWEWATITTIGVVIGTDISLITSQMTSQQAVATTHQTSITVVGGGASSGGQTVVVNGSGTGADSGGLSIGNQESWAETAAWDCDVARADHMADKPNLRGNFNTAIGYTRVANRPQLVVGPEFGVGGPATHAEPKIIVDWQKEIPGLGALPGTHLILLLFTRNPMCPPCEGMVPTWNQQLAAVAGPGVTVHFYVWESIDPYDDVGPLNIQPVPGL